MPISGLVITLSDTPALADTALAKLRGDRRIELGDRKGLLQPIVVDTAARVEDLDLWEELQHQEGIVKVDVVFVHIDEDRREDAGGPAPAGC